MIKEINLDLVSKEEHLAFFQVIEINYLLSTYNLSEACNYRESIKDLDLNSETNFFLKIDIFCLNFLQLCSDYFQYKKQFLFLL